MFALQPFGSFVQLRRADDISAFGPCMAAAAVLDMHHDGRKPKRNASGVGETNNITCAACHVSGNTTKNKVACNFPYNSACGSRSRPGYRNVASTVNTLECMHGSEIQVHKDTQRVHF